MRPIDSSAPAARPPAGSAPRRSAPRTRRVLLTGAVLAALGAGAWAFVATRGGEGAKSATDGEQGETRGMAGMDGMEGMTMGTDGTVMLSADQIRTFGVTFGTVERRTLESTVRTTGTVTIDESRVSQVAPKAGGFVERLYVDVTGQPVRRGQPLLELYSPELLAAQEELLVARRLDRTLGESAVPGVPAASAGLLGAARRRLRLLDVSNAQIDAVLRTGRARRTVTLHAPASGVVTEKRVVRGQAVAPGEALYTVADLARVWVEAELRAGDAASVRVGSAAEIELAGTPGRSFEGRVEYVYPTVDTAARTVRARIAVANATGVLKPGMYATVRLTMPMRRALTVPASAVVRTGERNVVFVDMGGGELMPHEVEVGHAAGDYTEVLAGVEPGQRVVTSAQFLLESESNIGEVMKAMMGQMGSGGMGGMDMNDMKDMPRVEMPEMPTDKGAGSPQRGQMRGMPGMSTVPAPATAGGRAP